MGKFALVAGAVFGLLGVAFGAFGAHALKPFLIEHGRLETFDLAVRYQFYHAFALLITGVLQRLSSPGRLTYAAICFVAGIVFFSGSLYVLCFTGLGILGAVTPIGGMLFIFGWGFIITTILKNEKGPDSEPFF